MNRRDFFIGSGSLFFLLKLGACSSKSIASTDEELAVFWHGQRPGGPEVLLPQASSDLIFIDPVTSRYEIFKIPLTAHSLIQDEERPEILYLFTKWSREVAVFRRDKGKITDVIERPLEFRVYGHGVWDRDRKGFWYTENDLRDRRGYLVFRDQNLKEKERIQTGGFAPHEVERGRDGSFIVVNSLGIGNTIPNVAWIDPQTLKLSRVVEFKQLENSGLLTHLTQSETDQRIFVSGFKNKDNSGSVVGMIDPRGTTQLFNLDSELGFRGEVFSFVHKKDELLWANPMTGALFTWDLKASKLKSVKTDKQYMGTAEMSDHLYLATKENQALYQDHEGQSLVSLNLDPAKNWGVHLHSIKKIV